MYDMKKTASDGDPKAVFFDLSESVFLPAALPPLKIS